MHHRQPQKNRDPSRFFCAISMYCKMNLEYVQARYNMRAHAPNATESLR